MPEPGSVQAYLREHIPLSNALGIEVVEAAAHAVTLSAPLAPNVNHRGTVFGGSAAAVATLSAWTLLYLRLGNEGIHCDVVIQKNAMTYACPITGRFTATCRFHDPAAWTRFLAALRKYHRARIKLDSVLHCGGKKVAEFDGHFVAIRDQKTDPPKERNG
jgi:thioesterase domain-containing protein